MQIAQFFGIREQPFGVTPDPRMLFLGPSHREALASLIYGLQAGRGFLALVAPPGMGKTTLLFHLLDQLRSQARTAFLFQTQCDSRELMRYLLADLGLGCDFHDVVAMHEAFNDLLAKESRAGRQVVVVIDEAQNLTSEVLETVRLLSDFETRSAKLLQIVLAGQEQLGAMLNSPGQSQLRQRLSMLCRLRPLDTTETGQYIAHRLNLCGRQDPLFTDDAVRRIAQVTEGTPRKINNLCFNAMSLAFALQQPVIGSDVIAEVIRDLELPTPEDMPVIAPATAAPVNQVNVSKETAIAAAPALATAPEKSFLTTSAEPPSGTSPLFGSAPLQSRKPLTVAQSRHDGPRRRSRRPLVFASIALPALVAGSMWMTSNWNQAAVSAAMNASVQEPVKPEPATLPENNEPTRTTEAPLTERSPGADKPTSPRAEPGTRWRRETSSAMERAKEPDNSTAVAEAVSPSALFVPSAPPADLTETLSEEQPPEIAHAEIAPPVLESIVNSSLATRPTLTARPEPLVPAKLILRVSPRYPQWARAARVEGQVVLRIGIEHTGEVKDVDVLSGHPSLAQAATEAVRQWRFSPSSRGAEPIRSEAQITFRFALPR